MDEQSKYIGRIEAALSRIRAATDGSKMVADGGGEVPLFKKVEILKTDNEALRAEVASLVEKREADVKELDTLLAELKPLIEEAS